MSSSMWPYTWKDERAEIWKGEIDKLGDAANLPISPVIVVSDEVMDGKYGPLSRPLNPSAV